MTDSNNSMRWWALFVLCLGSLMIVLDATIVNVALPSIKSSLGFSDSGLAWVVNAYLLTFGGFLLLGGRLGDLFGHRRLFIGGITLFTFASLLCGIAGSEVFLIAARALQGFGGATASAVALSLMMNLFTEPSERAKAMGYLGFVSSGGGSVGVLLGGILTGSFDWHWIFLVNLPVGIAVVALAVAFLPKHKPLVDSHHIDVAGAVTVTSSLMLAVYGIVGGNEVGWTSPRTLGFIGAAVVLFAIFIMIEKKAKAPLMPLSLFRFHNVVVANIAAVLWAAAMFAWFFLSALYLQLVLHFTPLQIGLSFLPANLIMAAFSLGLSAKLVTRFGLKKPMIVGLALAAGGLALFARAPVDGTFLLDVLPAMVLLGIGAGIAFNPLLLAAMNDVPPNESGLASGIVNTSFMMGGALGLAILASIAASRAMSLVSSGAQQLAALNSGYHAAFFVGALAALVAASLGFGLRTSKSFSDHSSRAH